MIPLRSGRNMNRCSSCSISASSDVSHMKFSIISNGKVFINVRHNQCLLMNRGLFKSLSLLLAFNAGINIPETVLLLDTKSDKLNVFINRWGLPIMVRMDFERLPDKKTLGGIPLYSIQTIKSIVHFLFNEKCFPIFHPHFDRFDDIYSIGAQFSAEDSQLDLEVVGKGFDASDLRLGSAIPHELITYDLYEEKITGRSIISEYEYNHERLKREAKALAFAKYIQFANQKGRLLSSIDEIPIDVSGVNHKNIPLQYTPLSLSDIRILADFVFSLREKVIPYLPYSSKYVASFSMVSTHDWLLWDIYGHWYKR